MSRLHWFLLLLVGSAHGHDLWLEPSGQTLTLLQGHRHGTHPGADTLDYGSQFVKSATCFDSRRGKKALVISGRVPWAARDLRDTCSALLLEMSSGYWSKTPWDTHNLPKAEVAGTLKSWLSKDSLKRLSQWSPAFAKPLGEGLEIVPESDPFALKSDDKLSVRVFFASQPLPDVPVAYHGDTRGVTDTTGRIAIRLRHGGLQLISASMEIPLGDGQADSEIRAATLQFELPK